MKKNLSSSIFVFSVILVSLLLLAGSQLEANVARAAGQESHGPQAQETMINPELRAFERYHVEQAAVGNPGIVYAVDPVDLKLFNAADPSPINVGAEIDANTARWISLGERYRVEQAAVGNPGIVYAVDPVDLKLFNAADPSPTNVGAEIDANTARWISLGERYREDTVNSDRVAAANIARWNAMGEHYQAIALGDNELATKAYIDRWDALGERYTTRETVAENLVD